MRYDYVFWDWNGTILDDVDIAVKSLNDILIKYGYSPITKEAYCDMVDTPIIKLYDKLFDLNKISFEKLAKEFNNNYKYYSNEITLNKGVLEKLKEFKKNSVTQVILSSSATTDIKHNLEKFGLLEFFRDILGADDFLAGDKIQRAEDYFTKNCVDKSKVLFVGDTVYDGKMSDVLGVKYALVSCGHQSYEQLSNYSNQVFDSIASMIL